MAAATIDSDVDALLELGKALSAGTESVDALLAKAEAQIQDVKIQSIAQEALMSKASFDKNTDFALLALQTACMLSEEDAACALIRKGAPTVGADQSGNTVAKWVGKKNLKKVARLLEIQGKPVGSFIDGLFLKGPICQEKDMVKMVAHIWGIKGKDKYESWNSRAAFTCANSCLTDFFNSPEFKAVNTLTSEEVEEIERAMNNGITKESDRKPKDDESLIVQVTGWDGHATSAVYALIKGNSPDENVWLVLKGNRGSGARYSEDADAPGIPGIQIYVVRNPDALLSTIEALKNPEDPDEFQIEMHEWLDLEKTGLSIPMKPQKVGNCAWASGVECAFLSTLYVVFLKKLRDPGLALKNARKVYKAFTTDFARRKSLEKYIQHVKDPDPVLLSLIQKKVIGKKDKWGPSLRKSLLDTLAKALPSSS